MLPKDLIKVNHKILCLLLKDLFEIVLRWISWDKIHNKNIRINLRCKSWKETLLLFLGKVLGQLWVDQIKIIKIFILVDSFENFRLCNLILRNKNWYLTVKILNNYCTVIIKIHQYHLFKEEVPNRYIFPIYSLTRTQKIANNSLSK